MLALSAHAGLLATAGPPGGQFMNIGFLVLMFAVFYFLLIRPQQKRMKEHKEMVTNLRRGDVVVTGGGIVGKIIRVAENEATLEISENVRIKVVKGTISEVRAKTEPAPANDVGETDEPSKEADKD